jgi:hypothetical protein
MKSRIFVAALGVATGLVVCALGATLLQVQSINKRIKQLQAVTFESAKTLSESPRSFSTIEMLQSTS